MTQLFDDEFMGPLTGALSGARVDVFDDMEPTMDVWEDKQWLLPGRRPVDKDPLRRLVGSIDINGRHVADDGTVLADPMDVVVGEFSLANWESSFQNGRIPSSALARVEGTTFLMEPHAAQAMAAMIAAAHADGVALSIGNSYRDYDLQNTMDLNDKTPATPTAAAGTSNHGWGTAADMQITPENHAWLVANAARFGYTNPFGNSYTATENWHWEFGQDGSSTSYTGSTASPPKRGGHSGAKATSAPDLLDFSGVNESLTGGTGTGFSFGGLDYAMADMLMPERLPGTRSTFSGSKGGINKQLYKGFMDAGRPDLAKMVGTSAFTAWVNAESGYRPDATSPENNQGMANDGLFQIWRGHDFNSDGQVAGMSPYQQAMMVAQYFDLSVDDIRRYAADIRSGSYSGWG